MQFKKAERVTRPLKLAITGPSGSGKTLSSLRMAHGIGGKVALIDTENSSASLYSDRHDFDTVTLAPPYTTAKYIDAMKLASDLGYNVVIVDSISHAWAGDGGLLSQKESADARGGNQYTNWAPITKQQEAFKSFILNYPNHLICTMRSKQDYVLVGDERGKQKPQKVGMAPIQREGMEYEFDTVFDVAMNHEAQTSKDRTGLFDGQAFVIDESTGKKIMEWKKNDKPIPPQFNMVDFMSKAKTVTSLADLDALYKANKANITADPLKDDAVQLFKDLSAQLKSVENDRKRDFDDIKHKIIRTAFEESLDMIQSEVNNSHLDAKQVEFLTTLIKERRHEIGVHPETVA